MKVLFGQAPPETRLQLCGKLSRALGSLLGGAEKPKWHSGSCSAVTRWILHTGAAVFGFCLGCIQKGVGNGSVVGLQCAGGGEVVIG